MKITTARKGHLIKRNMHQIFNRKKKIAFSLKLTWNGDKTETVTVWYKFSYYEIVRWQVFLEICVNLKLHDLLEINLHILGIKWDKNCFLDLTLPFAALLQISRTLWLYFPPCFSYNCSWFPSSVFFRFSLEFEAESTDRNAKNGQIVKDLIKFIPPRLIHTHATGWNWKVCFLMFSENGL